MVVAPLRDYAEYRSIGTLSKCARQEPIKGLKCCVCAGPTVRKDAFAEKRVHTEASVSYNQEETTTGQKELNVQSGERKGKLGGGKQAQEEAANRRDRGGSGQRC